MLIASADTCISGLATITTTINMANDDMYISLNHQDITDHMLSASSFISLFAENPLLPCISIDTDLLERKHPRRNDHLHTVALVEIAKIISLEKEFSDPSLAARIFLSQAHLQDLDNSVKNTLQSLGACPFSSFLVKALYWHSITKRINRDDLDYAFDVNIAKSSLVKEGFVINSSSTKEQSRNIAKIMTIIK